jgi:hypothetical protein
MLDKAQCQLLLSNNTIKNISEFLVSENFGKIRLCEPPHDDLEGKIILLVIDPTNRDDYDQLRMQQRLRSKLSYDDIILLVEEDLKDDADEPYRQEITGRSVEFNVENVKKFQQDLLELEGYVYDIQGKEVGEDTREVNIKITYKKSRVDDNGLTKGFAKAIDSSIEPYLVVVNGNNKRSNTA